MWHCRSVDREKCAWGTAGVAGAACGRMFVQLTQLLQVLPPQKLVQLVTKRVWVHPCRAYLLTPGECVDHKQQHSRQQHIRSTRQGGSSVCYTGLLADMSVACTYVPLCLQTQLVQGMAEVGEQALAEEYRKQLGLPQDTLAPPDPGQPHTHTAMSFCL
jgi:hypothetical protein